MKKFIYKAADTRHISISGVEVSLVKNNEYVLDSSNEYVQTLVEIGELEETIEVVSVAETTNPVQPEKGKKHKEDEKKTAIADSDTKTEIEK